MPSCCTADDLYSSSPSILSTMDAPVTSKTIYTPSPRPSGRVSESRIYSPSFSSGCPESMSKLRTEPSGDTIQPSCQSMYSLPAVPASAVKSCRKDIRPTLTAANASRQSHPVSFFISIRTSVYIGYCSPSRSLRQVTLPAGRSSRINSVPARNVCPGGRCCGGQSSLAFAIMPMPSAYGPVCTAMTELMWVMGISSPPPRPSSSSMASRRLRNSTASL